MFKHVRPSSIPLLGVAVSVVPDVADAEVVWLLLRTAVLLSMKIWRSIAVIYVAAVLLSNLTRRKAT